MSGRVERGWGEGVSHCLEWNNEKVMKTLRKFS